LASLRGRFPSMNNTAAVPDREPLAGLVERVTYHNPDNGYCVLRVKVRGHRDLVTVLGHAASISAGEFVQASGKWEVHREHGQQFRDAVLKSARLASLEGMEKYLGSRLIEDIGPDYTKKLVSTRRVLCSTLSAGRAAD
jgi:exodeoxyribonuclease V alpha subunit